MFVEQILVDKFHAIEKGEPVRLSLLELDTVCDVNQLRCLKMSHEFSSDFEPSKDIWDGYEKAKSGDLYRVLEVIGMCNLTTQGSIGKVFPHMAWKVMKR